MKNREKKREKIPQKFKRKLPPPPPYFCRNCALRKRRAGSTMTTTAIIITISRYRCSDGFCCCICVFRFGSHAFSPLAPSMCARPTLEPNNSRRITWSRRLERSFSRFTDNNLCSRFVSSVSSALAFIALSTSNTSFNSIVCR